MFPPRLHMSRTFGHKTITRLYLTDDRKFVMDLMYDYTGDKLSFQWIDHPLPLDSWSWDMLTPYITYEWNSRVSRLDIYNTTNGTTTMNSRQIDIREVCSSELLHEHSHQSNIEDGIAHVQLAGNSEVLCLASDEIIQLWFFNPKFVPDLLDSTSFPTKTEGSR